MYASRQRLLRASPCRSTRSGRGIFLVQRSRDLAWDEGEHECSWAEEASWSWLCQEWQAMSPEIPEHAFPRFTGQRPYFYSSVTVSSPMKFIRNEVKIYKTVVLQISLE